MGEVSCGIAGEWDHIHLPIGLDLIIRYAQIMTNWFKRKQIAEDNVLVNYRSANKKAVKRMTGSNEVLKERRERREGQER
jgi:hypothetical protein